MSDQTPWEPDRRLGGNWRSLFDQPRGSGPPPPGEQAPVPQMLDDGPMGDETQIDPNVYHPWILQRGHSRPSAMLGLRWYEAKAGFWSGCGMPYPMLQAVEYVGDRMVSLDFGTRQFVIEGVGLGKLACHIQQGTVLTIQEYTAAIWREPPVGSMVSAIRRLGMTD